MKIEVHPDAAAIARKAAEIIAADARAAVASRGRYVMAVSGGSTPWLMLRALADEQIPWENLHVVQVDERAAPAGDPERNLTHLRESLLDHAPLPLRHIHAMPVEAPDLNSRGFAICGNIAGRGGIAAGALISSISASASTATPPRWFPAIRSSRSPTRTSR